MGRGTSGLTRRRYRHGCRSECGLISVGLVRVQVGHRVVDKGHVDVHEVAIVIGCRGGQH